MARMSNPPWGLYVLTAAYLVCCARAQAASNNFDGAHTDHPQQSAITPTACLLQTQNHRCHVDASATCRRDHVALATLWSLCEQYPWVVWHAWVPPTSPGLS